MQAAPMMATHMMMFEVCSTESNCVFGMVRPLGGEGVRVFFLGAYGYSCFAPRFVEPLQPAFHSVQHACRTPG